MVIVMNKEELKIICDTEDLYETCENMEQLFDYYLQLAIEYHNLKQKNQKYKEVIDKAIEYLTSYSSIHTIQFGTENDSLNDIELNKTLDEKILNEMTNRYLKVHDKLLEILKEV